MTREMVLLVLGETERDILENSISTLGGICIGLRNLPDLQEQANRIEMISNIITDIKSKLDIMCKCRTYTYEISRVRTYIIELFSNLNEMVSAVRNHNYQLMSKYNEIVKNLILNYN